MTTQQATPRTTNGTVGRVLALTVAGAITVAVAAVSIGTWQGARPHAAPEASNTSATSTVGSTEASGTPAAGQGPVRTTYFVVSSEAEAEILRGQLASLRGPRPASGQPDATTVVLVAGDDAATLLEGLPRPPDTRVVDMRAAGSERLGAATAVPVTDQEMYQAWQQRTRTAPPTVYIAASEEQAQTMRTALAESDAIRTASGQSLLPYRVLWFDAPEAEVRFWLTQEAIHRGSGSGAASAVIDLRDRSVAP
jgi:hypothetical protein